MNVSSLNSPLSLEHVKHHALTECNLGKQVKFNNQTRGYQFRTTEEDQRIAPADVLTTQIIPTLWSKFREWRDKPEFILRDIASAIGISQIDEKRDSKIYLWQNPTRNFQRNIVKCAIVFSDIIGCQIGRKMAPSPHDVQRLQSAVLFTGYCYNLAFVVERASEKAISLLNQTVKTPADEQEIQRENLRRTNSEAIQNVLRRMRVEDNCLKKEFEENHICRVELVSIFGLGYQPTQPNRTTANSVVELDEMIRQIHADYHEKGGEEPRFLFGFNPTFHFAPPLEQSFTGYVRETLPKSYLELVEGTKKLSFELFVSNMLSQMESSQSSLDLLRGQLGKDETTKYLIIGPTGLGKTCLAKYMQGQKFTFTNNQKIVPIDNQSDSEIGHQNSLTKGVKLYDQAIDTAGFNDTRGQEAVLIAGMLASIAARSCNKLRLIYTIDETFFDDGCFKLRELVRELRRIVQQQDLPTVLSSTLFVFNKKIKKEADRPRFNTTTFNQTKKRIELGISDAIGGALAETKKILDVAALKVPETVREKVGKLISAYDSSNSDRLSVSREIGNHYEYFVDRKSSSDGVGKGVNNANLTELQKRYHTQMETLELLLLLRNQIFLVLDLLDEGESQNEINEWLEEERADPLDPKSLYFENLTVDSAATDVINLVAAVSRYYTVLISKAQDRVNLPTIQISPKPIILYPKEGKVCQPPWYRFFQRQTYTFYYKSSVPFIHKEVQIPGDFGKFAQPPNREKVKEFFNEFTTHPLRLSFFKKSNPEVFVEIVEDGMHLSIFDESAHALGEDKSGNSEKYIKSAISREMRQFELSCKTRSFSKHKAILLRWFQELEHYKLRPQEKESILTSQLQLIRQSLERAQLP